MRAGGGEIAAEIRGVRVSSPIKIGTLSGIRHGRASGDEFAKWVCAGRERKREKEERERVEREREKRERGGGGAKAAEPFAGRVEFRELCC